MMVQKNVERMVLLKYLSNPWRTLKMLLFNCEINLILTWSKNCFISSAAANQEATFATIYAKLYVPVVTLSTDDNGNVLLQHKMLQTKIYPGFQVVN